MSNDSNKSSTRRAWLAHPCGRVHQPMRPADVPRGGITVHPSLTPIASATGALGSRFCSHRQTNDLLASLISLLLYHCAASPKPALALENVVNVMFRCFGQSETRSFRSPGYGRSLTGRLVMLVSDPPVQNARHGHCSMDAHRPSIAFQRNQRLSD